MCYRFLVLAISLISIIISGCASIDSMESQVQTSMNSMESSLDSKLKASPAEGTGYVPMQQLAKNPDLPFDKV